MLLLGGATAMPETTARAVVPMTCHVGNLSSLQRAILRMAYERHGREPVDLFYTEILIDWFGFPSAVNDAPLKRGLNHFSRTQIGHRKYDAAQSALSRSVYRLAERGLVVVYQGRYSRWAGLKLTEEAVNNIPLRNLLNRNGETVRTGADLPPSQPFGGWAAK